MNLLPKFTKNPRILLVAMVFAVVGGAMLIYSRAASNETFFEAEDGDRFGAVSVTQDDQVSGGDYVTLSADTPSPSVTPTEPPVEGAMPTRANTGPRHALTDLSAAEFLSTRTCNRQRITGELRIQGESIKNQTYTLTDCEITGTVHISAVSGGALLPVGEMPTVNMDYVYIGGGLYLYNGIKMNINHSYMDAGSQWSVHDNFQPFIDAPAPISVTNSVFFGPYKSDANSGHTEALITGGFGEGHRFTNVTFLQGSGPLENTAVTATINYSGKDAVFDGCYFLWTDKNQVPAYYTAYFNASGDSVVKNSKFHSAGGYIYPQSSFNPRFENNTDIDTGAPVSFP